MFHSVPPLIRISAEPFDAPDAAVLCAELAAELDRRYGGDSEPGDKPTAATVAAFLVARDATGQALGCGALRPLDGDGMEIKRMYVRRGARGLGLGRMLLRALEDEAKRLGARSLVLETGPEQPEALGLYEGAGYQRIAPFGAYAGVADSVCYERVLP